MSKKGRILLKIQLNIKLSQNSPIKIKIMQETIIQFRKRNHQNKTIKNS